MTGSGDEPLKSFLNTIDVVKNAFSPLESNLRGVAKNFEHCFNGVLKCRNLNKKANDTNNKKMRSQDMVVHGGIDWRKGKAPILLSFGMFREKGVDNDIVNGVDLLSVNLSKEELKQGYETDDGGRKDNCLVLEMALSFFVNGFVQNSSKPFSNFSCYDSDTNTEEDSWVVDEIKRKRFKFKVGKGQHLKFARVRGVPPGVVGMPSENDVGNEGIANSVNQEDGGVNSQKKLADGLLSIPSSIAQDLRSTVSSTELFKLVTRVGRPSKEDHPDKTERKRLFRKNSRTLVAAPPTMETTTKSVLKSALAGGLSCAFSTALMHPIDTVKTQVQASTSLGFVEILSKLPQVGVRGLFKGSIPSILGQFFGHGLRTGFFEASKSVLINVAPAVPNIQVQSVASFSSTILGTVTRVPSEVLKQRLQANVFDNVGEAIVGTWKQDGLAGFFRGTGATLCRETPFYVAGAGLYAQSKKAVQKLLKRELEPWETIVVGAVSGGLIAISTTPFDVIKTRMMVAADGRSVTASMVALSILRTEGPLALFRGAVPRFFWVAPLGAINFAGYELLRKAMENW